MRSVEELAEFLLRFLGTVAAERLEQLGRELTALDQRIENCLAKRLDRAIGLGIEIVEIRIEVLPAREP